MRLDHTLRQRVCLPQGAVAYIVFHDLRDVTFSNVYAYSHACFGHDLGQLPPLIRERSGWLAYIGNASRVTSGACCLHSCRATRRGEDTRVMLEIKSAASYSQY